MWRFKLLVLGLAIYGGVVLVKRARARREASAFADVADDRITDADILIVGIAEVDPEGLAQMGEGIDLDGNAAAHEDIRAQRDRFPR
jgi:hypothetical protein